MPRDVATEHPCGIVTKHPSHPLVLCDHCANAECPKRSMACGFSYYEARTSRRCDDCHEDCPGWSP